MMNSQSIIKRPNGGLWQATASLLFLLATMSPVQGQESTVYAVVTATKLFVVGAANPSTGLFFQHPSEDSVWHHSGPNNYRAFGFAQGARSKGRVLYVAAGNGVHKSTDAGAHWKNTTGWGITEVLSVCPDSEDSNIVYCATPYGVMKSADGCHSWMPVNKGLNALFTCSVIVDRSDHNTVYCATEDGAYVSNDGAATWRRLGLSVSNTRVISQHPVRPEILAVGTENDGIYISTNGGRWWTKSEAGVDHQTFYAIVFDPTNPDVMYAGGYVTGVYKSTDGGKSWKRMNNGLSVLNIHSLAVDPRNSRRVYAGAYWGGVFRSDDAGGSWHWVGLPDSQVWSIVIQPN